MRARTLLVVIFAVVLAQAVPAPVSAASPYDDPFFLNWPTFLPTVPGDFVASTESDCPRGSNRCVDNVIREMRRRLTRVGCRHDSAFAFVYLRTTEEYRRAVSDPTFFTDNAFVNHEDVAFADYYFRAQDRYAAGDLAAVPPAWRIAFRAAERREVTTMGNILLGMNAHIMRDLPFVVNAIGMVKPDGSSRKPDHDKVNAILNLVGKTAITEAAARYDPTLDDGDVPGTTMDQAAFTALIQAWRELAWRNAELLRTAGTLGDQLNVAQLIEDQAASIALTVRLTYSYGLLRNSSARDAHCASHASA